MNKLADEIINYKNVDYYNKIFLVNAYNTLEEIDFIKSFNFTFVKQYFNPNYKYNLVVHIDVILDMSLYTMHILETGQKLEDELSLKQTSRKIVLNLIDIN